MNRKRQFPVVAFFVCFSLVESTLLWLHLEHFLAALGLLSSSGAAAGLVDISCVPAVGVMQHDLQRAGRQAAAIHSPSCSLLTTGMGIQFVSDSSGLPTPECSQMRSSPRETPLFNSPLQKGICR